MILVWMLGEIMDSEEDLSKYILMLVLEFESAQYKTIESATMAGGVNYHW